MAHYIHYLTLDESGKLIFDNTNTVKELIKEFGGTAKVKISVPENIRSIESNEYYWAGIISHTIKYYEDFGGWTDMELHRYLMGKIVEKPVIKFIGERSVEIYNKASSSEFSQKKMNWYIEQCIIELGNHGVEILSSEDYKKLKFAPDKDW